MDHGKILVEGSPSQVIEEYVGSGIVEAETTRANKIALQRKEASYEVIGDLVHIYTETTQNR